MSRFVMMVTWISPSDFAAWRGERQHPEYVGPWWLYFDSDGWGDVYLRVLGFEISICW